jgi:RNA polymerase sigma factor (sigma-70 family)
MQRRRELSDGAINLVIAINGVKMFSAVLPCFEVSRMTLIHATNASVPVKGDLLDDDVELASLVARMRQKDQAALEALFDAAAKRVYSVSLRIVRDIGLAAEVVDDTFFQAWREADRFDADRGNVLTWLLTICRSRALDALRRADIADCVENPDEFRADEVSLLAEPEQLLAQFQSESAVQTALTQLAPNERQAIALAFFRGLTHQEIAEHWQMPLGSVKTLLHRAFAQLRLQLEHTQ